MNCKDKVIIVTGGATRLGGAMSSALARQGANVVVHYHRGADAAQAIVGECQRAGGTGLAVEADFLDPVAAAKNVVSRAMEHFGRVDGLVNSASIFEPSSLAQTTEDIFDRHMAVNLKASVFMCQAFAGVVESNQRGHIINIADWRATRPIPGHLTYTLTKSGLVSLTRLLAQELAPNIQVNCICPGAILPPAGVDNSEADQLSARNVLGRMGGPREVTETLLYLLQSDFITGEVIHVTGGENL
jgi:NAD(P)-dependent dehydrogenase (short-subunit alcohol dehydrogenase family)